SAGLRPDVVLGHGSAADLRRIYYNPARSAGRERDPRAKLAAENDYQCARMTPVVRAPQAIFTHGGQRLVQRTLAASFASRGSWAGTCCFVGCRLTTSLGVGRRVRLALG